MTNKSTIYFLVYYFKFLCFSYLLQNSARVTVQVGTSLIEKEGVIAHECGTPTFQMA